MGSHGHSGVARPLLGSVTENVVRKGAAHSSAVPVRFTGHNTRYNRRCPAGIFCPLTISVGHSADEIAVVSDVRWPVCRPVALYRKLQHESRWEAMICWRAWRWAGIRSPIEQGERAPRRKNACSFLQYGGDAAPEDCHAVAQPQGSLLWEENISDSEALKRWIPFTRGAQRLNSARTGQTK